VYCRFLIAYTTFGFWRDIISQPCSADFHSSLVAHSRKLIKSVLKALLRNAKIWWAYLICYEEHGLMISCSGRQRITCQILILKLYKKHMHPVHKYFVLSNLRNFDPCGWWQTIPLWAFWLCQEALSVKGKSLQSITPIGRASFIKKCMNCTKSAVQKCCLTPMQCDQKLGVCEQDLQQRSCA